MLNNINLNGTPGAKVFFSESAFPENTVQISAEDVKNIDGAIGGIIIDSNGRIFSVMGFMSSGSLIAVQYVTQLASSGGGGGGGMIFSYYKTYKISARYSGTGSSLGYTNSANAAGILHGSFSVFSVSADTDVDTMLSDIRTCYGYSTSGQTESNDFPFSGTFTTYPSSYSGDYDYYTVHPVHAAWLYGNNSGSSNTLHIDFLSNADSSTELTPGMTSALTVENCTVVSLQ